MIWLCHSRSLQNVHCFVYKIDQVMAGRESPAPITDRSPDAVGVASARQMKCC